MQPRDFLVGEQIGHFRKVIARAEMIAGAANDEHLHIVIDVRAVNEVREAMPRGNRHRIVLVRTIHRDRRDLRLRILVVQDDFFRRRSLHVVRHMLRSYVFDATDWPIRAAIISAISNSLILPVAVLGTSASAMKTIRRGIL